MSTPLLLRGLLVGNVKNQMYGQKLLCLISWSGCPGHYLHLIGYTKVIAWKDINLAINSVPVSLWRQLATGYFDHNRWIQICLHFLSTLSLFISDHPSTGHPFHCLLAGQWPSVLCALLLLSVDWPNQVKFQLIPSQSHWNAQHRTKQSSGLSL